MFPFKQCTKCQHWREIDLYQKGHNRCNLCRDAYMKAWADKNRDKINENQRTYHATIYGRASVLLNGALKRARSKDEEFALTHDDVFKGISVGVCVKTLFPFDFSVAPRNGSRYHINPYSPSIDKIEPRGIYEPSNVQYVCSWYNLAKGQMTENDLNEFCRRIARLNP